MGIRNSNGLISTSPPPRGSPSPPSYLTASSLVSVTLTSLLTSLAAVSFGRTPSIAPPWKSTPSPSESCSSVSSGRTSNVGCA
ncbi:hypothetical protein M441DRAFT_299838 [Trichoderma asperellum CBS 433.97]|uniref:Uncharacterized protein n=1 Tax=Trichoderma asperellum (strain ATCC 204424 / CBS 433.97 / NBRC 101777) TaxID=1042311 RepID=A0A2T3ZJ61_TRIA4|nr:hypothetical protein M441DRAFT_299838 [Trichoderma asperellum CBS 433.97]PTB44851.1 hypothetical protein M441DRAFT_299838 [Trichoderma asperellum CBS 433.97]